MRTVFLFVFLSYFGSSLLSSIDWNAPLTPRVLFKLGVGLTLGLLSVHVILRWWRLWNGLDQWPNPGGRYYQRWLELPCEETQDDYYQWLANEKHGAEPWGTWARMEHELRARSH
jgi:hypothetical protein